LRDKLMGGHRLFHGVVDENRTTLFYLEGGDDPAVDGDSTGPRPLTHNESFLPRVAQRRVN
jgi:hypothetical protein